MLQRHVQQLPTEWRLGLCRCCSSMTSMQAVILRVRNSHPRQQQQLQLQVQGFTVHCPMRPVHLGCQAVLPPLCLL